jgi:hypothetical protein
LTSSSRIGFRSAYLIPVDTLNLLRSIVPPLLASIQRIRLRGDCEEGPVISELGPLANLDRMKYFKH